MNNEDRISGSVSPKVATYDLKPEMSAYEVKDKLVAAINENKYDFIVVNYANGDMVGHTGIYEAIEKGGGGSRCLCQRKRSKQLRRRAMKPSLLPIMVMPITH